jgi:hypothetical protein
LLETQHLALPRGRHADDLAGEPASAARCFIDFQFDRDQLRHTQRLGDRTCHEGIGRGDDGHQVAALLVQAHQRQRLVADRRAHDLLHEQGVCLARGLGPVPAHRFGGETHIVVDVQRAGLVLGEEFLVALRELFCVGPANGGREDAPGMVGVDRQQGVVQVEQRHLARAGHGAGHCVGRRQSHQGQDSSIMARIIGTVTARLARKA